MFSTITPTSVPPLTGFRNDYRLYTVEHIPFDAVPSYRDGGPGTVVVDGWCCSTTGWDHQGSVTANAFRFTSPDITTPPERHPLDGTKYPTQADAKRAQYEAGLLAFMVYEKDAARFGLPTA